MGRGIEGEFGLGEKTGMLAADVVSWVREGCCWCPSEHFESRVLNSLWNWRHWSFATYGSLNILLGGVPSLMMVDARVSKVEPPALQTR